MDLFSKEKRSKGKDKSGKSEEKRISGEAYNINKQAINIAPKSKIESNVHYALEPTWGIITQNAEPHRQTKSCNVLIFLCMLLCKSDTGLLAQSSNRYMTSSVLLVCIVLSVDLCVFVSFCLCEHICHLQFMLLSTTDSNSDHLCIRLNQIISLK